MLSAFRQFSASMNYENAVAVYRKRAAEWGNAGAMLGHWLATFARKGARK
jgi:hypothetical protein